MTRTLGFLLLLFSCGTAHCTEWDKLASTPEWLALLHVNQGSTLHDWGKSYVDDPRFFLAPNGKASPLDELKASLAALEPPGSPARCRFPARYFFLAETLGWTEEAPLSHCTEYSEWRQQIPSARVVLVFPASYLNSPSSMFGHTLLRLDSSQAPENVWNSWAVNYGAITTNQENSLLYVWHGLAGGYPGRFALVPYVSKIQEYSNLENRDIWEYSLQLGPQEVSRLINHLWELRDINFDYYFFDENCAFRLLELLQVARPDATLIEGFRLTEAPVSTVRTLYEKGLVNGLVYRPSKASELQADVNALSPHERQLAKRLLQDPSLALDDELLSSTPEKRHLMARTALRTLRFKERKNDRSEESAQRGLELLRVMQANPAPSVTIPQPTPPEEGHGTQLISIGAGQHGSRDFGELRYRLTYHDLIDNPKGFLQGAQIEGLDIRLRHTESDSLKLESLDLVNIRSLSPRNAFIKPLSWFVQAGMERAAVYQERELVSFVQGGAGLSWRWQALQPYALLSARLEHSEGYRPFIESGAGGSVGALLYLPAIQFNVGLEGTRFQNGEYRYRSQVSANAPLGQQDALRLQWRQEHWQGGNQPEFSIAWQHYFN